jgi:hypothetical protein
MTPDQDPVRIGARLSEAQRLEENLAARVAELTNALSSSEAAEATSKEISVKLQELYAQLDEIEMLQKHLDHRKYEVEESLIAERLPNSFAFTPPLDANGEPWRFLENKVLTRVCDEWSFRVNTDGKVHSIRWGRLTKEKDEQVRNAARWCERRTKQPEVPR